jgi:hypothetical protein
MNENDKVIIEWMIVSHRRGNIFGAGDLSHYMVYPDNSQRGASENLFGDLRIGESANGSDEPDYRYVFLESPPTAKDVREYENR